MFLIHVAWSKVSSSLEGKQVPEYARLLLWRELLCTTMIQGGAVAFLLLTIFAVCGAYLAVMRVPQSVHEIFWLFGQKHDINSYSKVLRKFTLGLTHCILSNSSKLSALGICSYAYFSFFWAFITIAAWKTPFFTSFCTFSCTSKVWKWGTPFKLSTIVFQCGWKKNCILRLS